MLYNVLKGEQLVFQDVAKGSANEVVLPLPKGFVEGGVHGWMQYVSKDRSGISTIVYIGELI